MKLQIDTTNKTIKVEGNINLKELFDGLKRLLPEGEWEKFTLESNTIIEWINPITIPYVPYIPTVPTTPWNPWWQSPIVTCQGSSGTYTLNDGVYNVSI
jgi:hypothetical protein